MEAAGLRHTPAGRRVVGFSVVLGLLATLTRIALSGLLAHLVAEAFLAHDDEAGPFIAFALVAILHACLQGMREALAQGALSTGKAELRAGLIAHLLRQGPARLRGDQTGELAAVAGEGIERLDPYILRYRPHVVLSASIPLVIGVAVATRDWISAVILLATAPVLPLLMVLVGKYAGGHIQRQWTALARMSAHFLDTVQGLTTLKAFGRGAVARESVRRVSLAYRDRTLTTLRYAFLSGLVLEFITAGAIALVAVSLGIRLLAGDVGFEQAFFVLLLTPEFYRPLRELGQHRHAAMEARAPAERIGALLGQTVTAAPVLETAMAYAAAPSAPDRSRRLRYPTEVGNRGRLERSPQPAIRLAGPLRVVLHGVGYTYPGNEYPALEGLDLVLEPGRRTALVGRSGAGKTTLLSLLLQFIEPAAGTIEVNGIAIGALPAEVWRTHLAYVPQRPHLFSGSVKDNIALGRPDADWHEIQTAAALAGADRFVERLPHGYETEIGERGLRLSGGEAQRIALARAFLKDAPVLLLDEPASHLDPASEAQISGALERLMDGRTVLIAAHRLTTVGSADRIVVLEDGRVVEQGTHRDLVLGSGHYARLVGASGLEAGR